ncbi:digestive cysteine proteinase 1-like [Convolutriloba macropyga]|uniref:digestive cysteine proteinase 1-like n=1 Tax=Convolutriloba macropyga TaxID=536237 RepID=UPI003F525ADB
MNVLVVIFSCLVAVAFSAIPNKILTAPEAELWKAWKNKYNKEYDSMVEEVSRFDIWKESLKQVSVHNIGYDLGLNSYSQEVNEFADMTSQEFTATRLGFRGAQKAYDSGKIMEGDVSGVPSSMDWRDHGYVTGVKNQGSCGSCWSFSSTGSVEGVHFNATGKLVSLSEEELVECDNTDYGCNGGWPANGIDFFAKYGAIAESDYPYTSGNGYSGYCKYRGKPIAAHCSGHVPLAKGNENNLMIASASVGPISIAIDASHKSFQNYRSGVYYESRCSSSRLDHAVLLVGYGTYYGSPYWLVKNSWGTSWGMKGYIMMARNRNNNCGVATEAVYAYA